MHEFEDNYILQDEDGNYYESIDEVLEYINTKYCDYGSSDDLETSVLEFLQDNDLAEELPETARRWRAILNSIESNWRIVEA